MSAQAKVWHIDRRIPLMLIISLSVQVAVVVIWATYLEARVSTIEASQLEPVSFSERFARLEERIIYIQRDIALIRRHIEKTR